MTNTTELEEMADDITTIRIKKNVRDELARLGTYNETMSDIIAKCIKAYKEKHKI